ncbi:MAG TPA: hypothetical protein PLH31_04455, partial [Caulobacter sp.]|nr:hypothetical protein [Caulobacter sp.]
VNWQFVRNYDLAELLSVLREQVSSDDDVLTQFYDPGEVYPLLDGARDFADVLAIWSKLERGPNEEQP